MLLAVFESHAGHFNCPPLCQRRLTVAHFTLPIWIAIAAKVSPISLLIMRSRKAKLVYHLLGKNQFLSRYIVELEQYWRQEFQWQFRAMTHAAHAKREVGAPCIEREGMVPLCREISAEQDEYLVQKDRKLRLTR